VIPVAEAEARSGGWTPRRIMSLVCLALAVVLLVAAAAVVMWKQSNRERPAGSQGAAASAAGVRGGRWA
jgi:hypothetical protein